MYNRNSYYDGKQKYEIRICGTNEVIESGFTSQKATLARIRELKKVMSGVRFTIWGYKDSERQ